MNRRDFLGNTAKALIPITGAFLAASNPTLAKALEHFSDENLPAPHKDKTPFKFEGFNERVQAYIVARYYVRLTDTYGKQGRNTFLLATRTYAEQRGHRMAQRALADGQELTFVTYHKYGEWVPSEEIKKRGESNLGEPMTELPYQATKITRCPWAIQFREMGLTEAGLAYCKDLDASIYRGFNPAIAYETRQTLHDHDYCVQCAPGTRVSREELACPKVKEGLRSFEYHCAHTYWTFRQVVSSVFGNKGQNIAKGVLSDIKQDLGESFFKTLVKYEKTDFNVAE